MFCLFVLDINLMCEFFLDLFPFLHMFSRLRTLLKTAKKKLHPQDVGRTEFGSPMSSLRMDLDRHSQAEGAFGRMKDKVRMIQHHYFGVNPQIMYYL